MIQCGAWEAIYILDGLLQNASEIQPKVVHSDTQGQSLPVFALCHLLGISLMPRIRNWKDLNLYKVSDDEQYKHIGGLFCDGRIDWDLLEKHWKDLMQVVLSIKHGRISSSFLLEKLNSYNYQNKLYKAFKELGKVIRTIFLLEYISDLDMRQTITATCNKVESYNGFEDWVKFGAKKTSPSQDPEQMEKAMLYTSLITNSMILQNIVDLTQTCQNLEKEGYKIHRECLERMSPYLTSYSQ